MNIFGKCLTALLKQKNKLLGGKLIFMQANKAKTVPNQKVMLLVDLFGQETSVEVELNQIQKA